MKIKKLNRLQVNVDVKSLFSALPTTAPLTLAVICTISGSIFVMLSLIIFASLCFIAKRHKRHKGNDDYQPVPLRKSNPRAAAAALEHQREEQATTTTTIDAEFCNRPTMRISSEQQPFFPEFDLQKNQPSQINAATPGNHIEPYETLYSNYPNSFNACVPSSSQQMSGIEEMDALGPFDGEDNTATSRPTPPPPVPPKQIAIIRPETPHRESGPYDFLSKPVPIFEQPERFNENESNLGRQHEKGAVQRPGKRLCVR